VIVVARYVPGGRVAATMTAGSVGYPLRRFTPFAAVAGVTWAIYTAMIGFVGGTAFEDEPLKALLLGFGLAASAALLVEVGRHLVRHRRAGRLPGAEPR
jgi:membrane protein DedA with SNARE-associated domain